MKAITNKEAFLRDINELIHDFNILKAIPSLVTSPMRAKLKRNVRVYTELAPVINHFRLKHYNSKFGIGVEPGNIVTDPNFNRLLMDYKNIETNLKFLKGIKSIVKNEPEEMFLKKNVEFINDVIENQYRHCYYSLKRSIIEI